MKRKIMSLTQSINVRSFYSGPEWFDGISTITHLKNKMGIEVNGQKTFHTDTISSIKETLYNGFSLKLEHQKDRIYLKVDNSVFNPYWKVENLLTMITIKNPLIRISEEDVIRWVKDGVLVVKFNVLKKDHGTIWSFENKRFQLMTFRSLTKKRVMKERELEDCDFFQDF